MNLLPQIADRDVFQAQLDQLRVREKAHTREGDAIAATERMSLPVMLLFLGFLAFIAYPALTQVLNGL